MKRLSARIVPLLLTTLMVVLYASGSGRGDSVMKNVAFAAERPPIDLARAAKLETATFALG